ncbi:MAG: superinfection immunity protein [Chloroflexi bacterium]|nr:superinfection immunity protein [Chloroflexota bacterium]
MFDSTGSTFTATGILLAAIVIICGSFLYFSPSIVAHLKEHKRTASIFLVNLILGWTVIGWVVVWIWMLRTMPKTTESGRRSLQPSVRTMPGSSLPSKGDAARGESREGTESKRRT